VREAIRQDPDVIAVGEVVDNLQAGDVLRAALTGHKVLTTFHAEDAVGAAFRLLDAGVMTFFKSSTAITIVCQRLVRKICPNCRHAIAPDPQKIREFRLRDFDPDKHDFFEGSGCADCQNTGFVGRTGIFEVLTVNDRLREAFLTGAKARDILQTARATTAFLNLHEVGMLKAIRGVTTIDEVARMVPLASRDREMESPLTIQEIERTSEGAFVK
jgi:type IV pilus assembly protein PilB